MANMYDDFFLIFSSLNVPSTLDLGGQIKKQGVTDTSSKKVRSKANHGGKYVRRLFFDIYFLESTTHFRPGGGENKFSRGDPSLFNSMKK